MFFLLHPIWRCAKKTTEERTTSVQIVTSYFFYSHVIQMQMAKKSRVIDR